MQIMTLKRTAALLTVGLMAGAGWRMTTALGDDRGGPPGDQPGRNDGAQGPRDRSPGPPREPESLSGTLAGFNLGPQGEPEGLLVKDGSGKILQVNFPPPVAFKVQGAVAVGDSLTLSAVPMRSAPDHPVYGLVSVTGAKGQKVDIAPPGESQGGHAEGTIKYLNYDRGGQVNGAVLISGDFVEIGRAASRLNLQVGEKLTADGPAHPMADGQQCIRADTVNGQTVDRSQDRQRGGGGQGQQQTAGRRGPPQQPRDDYGSGDRAPSDRGGGGRDRGRDANGNGPDDGPPPQRDRGDRPPPPPQNDGNGPQNDGNGPPPREGRNGPPPQDNGNGRQPDGNQPPAPGGRNAPPPPPDQQ